MNTQAKKTTYKKSNYQEQEFKTFGIKLNLITPEILDTLYDLMEISDSGCVIPWTDFDDLCHIAHITEEEFDTIKEFLDNLKLPYVVW